MKLALRSIWITWIVLISILKHKKMKKKTIIILSIILFFIVLIGLAVYGVIWYVNETGPVSSRDSEIKVTIPNGKSSSEIGGILNASGLIKNWRAYKIYIKMNKINDMKAGDYVLNENMSLSKIVAILEKGPDASQRTVNITFLEGKNMRWIAKTIANNTNNTEDDVYNTLKNEQYLDGLIKKYWFLSDDIKNENIYYSLEGYLFPDTYNFKKDASVQDIFEVMLNRMEQKLDEYKSQITGLNISVHRLITVASIVELEASNVLDRPDIASVIYNRIKNNMSIGSDVTTYYAIKVDMGERDLKQSELDAYNPYNTRGPNMRGKLPVGPICNPGIDSIKAALNPSTTDYLYFVADKNGKVYFAKTDSEHNSIIQQLKSQGLWYSYE